MKETFFIDRHHRRLVVREQTSIRSSYQFMERHQILVFNLTSVDIKDLTL